MAFKPAPFIKAKFPVPDCLALLRDGLSRPTKRRRIM